MHANDEQDFCRSAVLDPHSQASRSVFCRAGTTIRSGAGDAGKLAQFYRHWSMKEAYIKAVGIGLGFELRRAEFRYVEGSDQTMAMVNRTGPFFHAKKLRPSWPCRSLSGGLAFVL